MFVRKKKNKSGKVSVQIISKTSGKYKVVKTVGCSNNLAEVEKLFLQAHYLIPEIIGQTTLALETALDKQIDNFVDTLASADIRVIGPELILGHLFDSIGFNIFSDDLFRHLVISRLSYPGSKLKTIDYLQRHKNIFVSSDKIYRFLDELQSEYKEKVEKIAFEHTKKILKGKIAVVFYDMTTLYFETEDEDDLRKIGFSKDGKFQNPQIMLGLLVGENGYPIGYDIFKGNTFEGHTLLPFLEQIQKKYGFEKPIVVADAGLLSKDNLEKLAEKKYKYIIGARIKNETGGIKENILEEAKKIKSGDSFALKKSDKIRLVVAYSDKRARKDKHNRDKGLRKLKIRVGTGKLTKQSINSRGYNKFLTLEGNIKVQIDEDKIKEDEKWDGLKGYITNTRFSPKRIIENYAHLWQIEKAFRISKTDLKIRPIYHRLEKRIEAHICIAFAAYTIYKELERILDRHKIGLSANRAIELTQNIYEISYISPDSKKQKTKYLKMENEQQILFNIIKNI
jgi:transposase